MVLQAHCCLGAWQAASIALTANTMIAVFAYVHTHRHLTQLLQR
jgi:hypothetical protein